MAGKEKIRSFINDTKHCYIGLNPQTTVIVAGQSAEEQPLPWKRPSLGYGNAHWYLPPGRVWEDKNNYYDTLVNQGYEKGVFVHCESEEELALLAETSPSLNGTYEKQVKKEVVQVPRVVRDSAGKLKGFWGCCYILKDITKDMKKAAEMGMSMLSSPEGKELLEQKEIADAAVAARNASELARAQVAKELEEHKKEIAALKKKQAIK